jgi:hypothetical protein
MITHEELVAKGWNQECDNLFNKCFLGLVSIDIVFNGDDEFIGAKVLVDNAILPKTTTLADLESLVALLTGKEQTCEWEYKVRTEWNLSCRGVIRWGWIGDNPLENEMVYCPYCGKRIVVKE